MTMDALVGREVKELWPTRCTHVWSMTLSRMASSSRNLINQKNGNSDPGFSTGYTSRMALTSQILDQHYLAWTEPSPRAITNADFSLSRESDNVIAAGLLVPVTKIAWFADSETETCDRS